MNLTSILNSESATIGDNVVPTKGDISCAS